MIPPLEFRDHVIRRVLHHLVDADQRLGSRVAKNLLLGTAIMESRLKRLEQVGGPAMSMFQIEPPTFADVYERYLMDTRRDLMGPVNDFLMRAMTPADQLAGNQHFACAIARIKFWMSPEPLPAADNIDALGAYWKAHYNTPEGKGTAVEWALLYRKHVPRD